MKKIFVSGPFSLPNSNHNTYKAIQVGVQLRKAGFLPFIPHLFTSWDLAAPNTYDFFLQMCFEWLFACDAVVRLPGESFGGNQEVALAISNKIPVYFGLDNFLAAYPCPKEGE